jgi:hypothetical protein
MGKSLNIGRFPIGEINWRDQRRGTLDQIYRWAEQNALTTYDWYMREKESKSRWSKSLRVLAIIGLVVGGLVPVVSLATDESLDARWGYVALAIGASFLVTDRGFGFSNAWMRYLRTAAALSLEIGSRQLEWIRLESELLGQEPTVDQIQDRIDFLRSFIVEVGRMVETETAEWSTEFSAGLSQLSSTLVAREGP